MIVYQTNTNGIFVGATEADESPLEPGVFLIPGGCVEQEPPALAEGEQARWIDGAWLVEPVPPPPEPETPEEPPVDAIEAFRRAIQGHIDQTAQSRSYDTGISCASYVGSTNPVWAAEAAAFTAWRDDVWTYAYAELAKVQNGQRPQPTVETILAELPALTWPA